MFIVYWTRSEPDGWVGPLSETFDSTHMSDALKKMEELRKDVSNSFVTMCSENPNSVGKPGVDEVGSDYNWTKRRGNMPGYKK